jgi:hypothetical protein
MAGLRDWILSIMTCVRFIRRTVASVPPETEPSCGSPSVLHPTNQNLAHLRYRLLSRTRKPWEVKRHNKPEGLLIDIKVSPTFTIIKHQSSVSASSSLISNTSRQHIFYLARCHLKHHNGRHASFTAHRGNTRSASCCKAYCTYILLATVERLSDAV